MFLVLGNKKILSYLLSISFLFLLFSFFTKPVSAQQEVCFCHNLEHNPVTICTDNSGLISGHMDDVQNGNDTLGDCQSPTPTPTDTPDPTDPPDPTDTPKPSETPYCSPTPSCSPISSCTPKPTCQPSSSPCPTSGTCGNTSCQNPCGAYSGGVLFGSLTQFFHYVLGSYQTNYDCGQSSCTNNCGCTNSCPTHTPTSTPTIKPTPTITPTPTSTSTPKPTCTSSCDNHTSSYNFFKKFFRR